MKPGYSRIAWGLVFELIDFRIQFFDVFPDVIGFLLIMTGLSQLRPQNPRFKTAWAAAGVLLILSVPFLFGSPPVEFSTSVQYLPDFAKMLRMTAEFIVMLIMMFGICTGIRVNALAQGRRGLADYARKIWSAMFALGVVWLISFPSYLNIRPADLGFVSQIAGIGLFIVSLWVISLVRRAGKNPGPGGGNGSEPAQAAQTTVA